jgi:hypothetical protein
MRYQPSIKSVPWIAAALLIAFGVWGYFMWASYGDLPGRVKKLEAAVELLKYPTDSVAPSTALDLQKLQLQIEKTEADLRSDFLLIQKIGIPATLIALALMFFSIYKSALGFALDKARKTIDRYYLPDEERLKQEAKLLVLTKEGGDSAFIRKFLHDTGFLAASTIPPKNVEQLDETSFLEILAGENYDLIFLNGEGKKFEDAEIQICHSKTLNNTMIFSFNNTLPKDLVESERAASANFKSQIYGNLINALKYQQYLRRGQNSTSRA